MRGFATPAGATLRENMESLKHGISGISGIGGIGGIGGISGISQPGSGIGEVWGWQNVKERFAKEAVAKIVGYMVVSNLKKV